MSCPCGRRLPLEACCGKFIEGWEAPETAEELMRSRFTAYATSAIDYLVATHDPAQAPDRESVVDWAKRAKFTSLEIVEVRRGGPDDRTGVVEFVARFIEDGEEREHRERSRFKRIDGRWFYVDAVG